MSTLQRDRAASPLAGVQILQVTPLPQDCDGTVPRSRGTVFFCPHTLRRDATGEEAPAWPC